MKYKTMPNKFGLIVQLIVLANFALLASSCKSAYREISTDPIQHDVVQEHSASVFIVMYNEDIGKSYLLNAIKEYKAEVVYDYSIIPGMAIQKPENKSLEETMQFFRKVKGVISVEYDRIYHLIEPVKPKLEVQ